LKRPAKLWGVGGGGEGGYRTPQHLGNASKGGVTNKTPKKRFRYIVLKVGETTKKKGGAWASREKPSKKQGKKRERSQTWKLTTGARSQVL